MFAIDFITGLQFLQVSIMNLQPSDRFRPVTLQQGPKTWPFSSYWVLRLFSAQRAILDSSASDPAEGYWDASASDPVNLPHKLLL